jgi:hypothetical protein
MRISGIWIGLLAAGVVAAVWAQEEEKELGVQHADCTYFGPQRHRFLKGGLLEVARETAALSGMTDQVAGNLPPLPPRSRSGALQPATGLTSIDEILFSAMRINGITPTEPSTDQEFLRRVTLDLTGRIPTAAEVTSFLADTSAGKRAALVERLLATPQWVDKWTMFFGDLFGNATRTT